MYLAETRTRPIVEVDLPDLPFVCSNVRFVHYVLAGTHLVPSPALPTPDHVHTWHAPGQAGSAACAMGGRQGLN